MEAEDEENAMSAKELEEAKKREKEEQAKKVKILSLLFSSKSQNHCVMSWSG